MLPARWRAAIEDALDEIGRPAGTDPLDDATVHALRRAAKRVRALVSLTPTALAVLAEETADCADTLRRALGSARDEAVRRETLIMLIGSDAADAPLLEPFLPPSDVAGVPPAPNPATLRDLALFARSWSRCDLRHMRDADVTAALARSYGRARRRRDVDLNDTAALHALRRRIVDLDLQLATFAGGSTRLRRWAGVAHRLRDLLGVAHDIDALLAFAATIPDASSDVRDALAVAAAAARARLHTRIEHHVRRFFKRSPRRWREELSAALYAAERTREAGSGRLF